MALRYRRRSSRTRTTSPLCRCPIPTAAGRPADGAAGGRTRTCERDRVGVATAAPDETVTPLLPEPDGVDLADYKRTLLQRFATAFENYDVPAMVKLFRSDAEWEMPPLLNWVRGPVNIGRLIAANCPAQGPGDMVMVPVSANGQPAFAMYMRGPDGAHHAFQIQVLTVTPTGVSHAVAFFDESKLPLLDPNAPAPDPSATTLFASFGLPQTLPNAPSRP
jgi:hypothetical protein